MDYSTSGVPGKFTTTSAIIGIDAAPSVTGDQNTIYGALAGSQLTTGKDCVFAGYKAAYGYTTGGYSVAIGAFTLQAANANGSVAIGYGASYYGGNYVVSIGYYADYYGVGTSCTKVGYECGMGVSGQNNTHNSYFGYQCGKAVTSGSNNLAAGSGAFAAATTAGTSVVLGKGAAAVATTNGGLVCVGYMSGAYETASDKLFIDNQDRTDEATARTSSLIYGVFNATPSSQTFTINGNLLVRYGIVNIPSAIQSVADDAAISPNAKHVRVAGDGGAAVLDTDPAISDGSWDGQELRIEGTSDANTVQIADACNTDLAGAAAVTLGAGDSIDLFWNGTDELWREISRANV